MKQYQTYFGSLLEYDKGGVEVIDDDPRHYAFSNVFEVATNAKPWEKVIVAQNQQYVLEAVRVEGTSMWRTAAHDEFALVMDGTVDVDLVKPDQPLVPADREGSVGLEGEPAGRRMGRVAATRGHQVLLPANSAYRLQAETPAVVLLQTIKGDDSVERWAEICQTAGARGRGPSAPAARSPRLGASSDVQARSSTAKRAETDGVNQHGYRSFTIGEFTFSRDEYFARVSWPTGSHIMSIDAFLRAVQRDVAWNFFYGIVNFDDVVGTINHYGNVDLFAGSFNESYRRAEVDHLENFPHDELMGTFRSVLADWTNDGFDPFASPQETGTAWGDKAGSNTAAVTRRRVTARRMVGVAGDEPLRSDETGHLINRMFADVDQSEPQVEVEPGFEAEVAAFSLFAYLSRSDVTWNPSVVSACKDSLFCPTTEEYILPIIHGNDRVEWFVQLSDRIDWEVEDRDTGAKRARVTMKAGDVAAMPADIRHQGYSPKRSMLLVWENASPELPELIASGRAPTYPVDF